MKEVKMLSHKELKSCALDCSDAKAEYARLDEEFFLLDKFLKVCEKSGISKCGMAPVQERHFCKACGNIYEEEREQRHEPQDEEKITVAGCS